MTANEFFAAVFELLHDVVLVAAVCFIGVLVLAILAELLKPPAPGRHRLNEDEQTIQLPEVPQEVRNGVA